jgi:hypothetical protein
MMKRRTIIGGIVFIIGTAVYLMASGAPLRVHIVTIPAEFSLFAVVMFFLCGQSMKAVHRMIGAALGVTMLAIVSTWVSSKVIAALDPLAPIYFVMGLVGLAVQAIVFAGVVWALDFAMQYTRRRATASEQSGRREPIR